MRSWPAPRTRSRPRFRRPRWLAPIELLGVEASPRVGHHQDLLESKKHPNAHRKTVLRQATQIAERNKTNRVKFKSECKTKDDFEINLFLYEYCCKTLQMLVSTKGRKKSSSHSHNIQCTSPIYTNHQGNESALENPKTHNNSTGIQNKTKQYNCTHRMQSQFEAEKTKSLKCGLFVPIKRSERGTSWGKL